MFDRSGIREGMTVRSSDGEKLGKVFAIGEQQFQIEKGLFFPKDYLCSYTDIVEERDGELILAQTKEWYTREHAGFEAASGRDTVAAPGTGLRGKSGRMTGVASETAIPIAHEELDVQKRERQVGEVVITKEVVEEEREVRVPVRKERVRVERRPVDSSSRPEMRASSFQGESVSVPIREEEVDVQKRAVVDEEVVVRKEPTEEERRVAQTVRREEVNVDQDKSRTGIRSPDDDKFTRR